MAEPITRVISGTGTISIPSEWGRYREIYLYTSVVRRPFNSYLNLNYEPARSRYGSVSIVAADEYVVRVFPIEHIKQGFTLFSLQSSQNLLALICALDAILETFVNLGQAIPTIFPISVINPIKEFTYVAIDFNRCIVKCYADTAIYVALVPVEMSECSEVDGVPSPPPLPPPPPLEVPPGTPLNGEDGNPLITPPQEGEPEDLNSPYPGDTDEPSLPDTVECDVYEVLVRSKFEGPLNPTSEIPYTVYGRVGKLFAVSNGQGGESLFLECQGLFFGGEGCQSFDRYFLEGAGAAVYEIAEIVSITPV